jgi:hypothetical protein
MLQVPCRYCNKHSESCHSQCDDYNKYLEEKETLNKQINSKKSTEKLHRGFVVDQLCKSNKRQHRA